MNSFNSNFNKCLLNQQTNNNVWWINVFKVTRQMCVLDGVEGHAVKAVWDIFKEWNENEKMFVDRVYPLVVVIENIVWKWQGSENSGTLWHRYYEREIQGCIMFF